MIVNFVFLLVSGNVANSVIIRIYHTLMFNIDQFYQILFLRSANNESQVHKINSTKNTWTGRNKIVPIFLLKNH